MIEKDSKINEITVTGLRAGWGHLITGITLADFFGVPIMVPDGREIPAFNSLSLLHGAVQQKDCYGQIPPNVLSKMNDSLDKLKGKRFFFRLLFPKIANFLSSNNDYHKKHLTEYLLQNPRLASIVFNFLIDLYYLLVNHEIDRYFKLLEQTNLIRVTTHGATLGRTGGINIILDPGFAFAGINFAPQNLLAMLSPKGVNLVPTELERWVLKKYYGKDAFCLGTIGQLVQPEDVKKKWENVGEENNPLIILLSTSGNAANLDEILELQESFINKERVNTKLVIFLGEHPDEINPLINSIVSKAEVFIVNKIEDIEQLMKSIKQRSSPLVVRTADQILTARVKLVLQRLSHVEAVKPGEASFMNQHTATFTYFLKPAGPNEPMNGIWSSLIFGASLPFPNNKWRFFVDRFFNIGIYDLINLLGGNELLSFAFADPKRLKEVFKINKDFFDQIFFSRLSLRKATIVAYCRAKNLVYALDKVFNEKRTSDPPNELIEKYCLDGTFDRMFKEIETNRIKILSDFIDS